MHLLLSALKNKNYLLFTYIYIKKISWKNMRYLKYAEDQSNNEGYKCYMDKRTKEKSYGYDILY